MFYFKLSFLSTASNALDILIKLDLARAMKMSFCENTSSFSGKKRSSKVNIVKPASKSS